MPKCNDLYLNLWQIMSLWYFFLTASLSWRSKTRTKFSILMFKASFNVGIFQHSYLIRWLKRLYVLGNSSNLVWTSISLRSWIKLLFWASQKLQNFVIFYCIQTKTHFFLKIVTLIKSHILNMQHKYTSSFRKVMTHKTRLNLD